MFYGEDAIGSIADIDGLLVLLNGLRTYAPRSGLGSRPAGRAIGGNARVHVDH
jgi:hypothetical protein